MTEELIVSDIINSYDGSCSSCGSTDSDKWIQSAEKVICVDCCFNMYNVKYEVYLETILGSRRKSIQEANSKQEPAELIGQCHRNSAFLASELNSKHSIPKDHIVVVSGYFNDDVKGRIPHYWVGIKTESTRTIYMDSAVPVDNDGIWVDEDLPSNYTVEKEIRLTDSYMIPSEVRKWLSI